MITADGSPIRVAIDVTSLLGQRTGVGHMVGRLAGGLALRHDVELTGVSASWRGGRIDDVLPSGCRPRTLALPARVSHSLWRRFDRPRIAGFDVMHGPNYVVPPVMSGARLVTVHDLTAWRFPELVDHHSRHYPEALRRAIARGAHVHAVSRFVAEELVAELGVDPDRVHAIPNGFTAAPDGDPAIGRRLVGAPYVLAIGTIEPRKDYATLVSAMASVWDVHPDVRLAIAGGAGWGVDEFDQQVRTIGAENHVVRLGYVTDRVKADLLAGARVLAYPSIYEGFGFPILEAMAAGLPVVSTTAGAIPETAGRAAVLVAPRDPTSLAGALLTLIEDDALHADLGEAGRRWAAGFSWDETVDRMVDLYRHLGRAGGAGMGAGSSNLSAERR